MAYYKSLIINLVSKDDYDCTNVLCNGYHAVIIEYKKKKMQLTVILPLTQEVRNFAFCSAMNKN